MFTIVVFLVAFFLGSTMTFALNHQIVRRLHGRSSDYRELELDILRAAMLLGGRITALDVRSKNRFSVAEIEEYLRKLHTQGYCSSDLTDEGQHVYVFGAFDDTSRKARAIEKTVFLLAKINSGKVQAASLVNNTDLSFMEARHLLQTMASQGMCDSTGVPDEYRFFDRSDSEYAIDGEPLLDRSAELLGSIEQEGSEDAGVQRNSDRQKTQS